MREAFRAQLPTLDAKELVFLDEAGSNISMSRTYGRAPVGQRVQEYVPRNRGTVTTMIGALTLTGLVAMMTVEGGTDAEVFETFIEKCLVPELHEGNIVVIDNVGAHRTPRVRELIESAGARLVFLPPYSPEFNPIEECWSKVKEFIRALKPRSRTALDFVVALAMREVTPSDAQGWFGHAGYHVRSN